jgi:hypothetical protein
MIKQSRRNPRKNTIADMDSVKYRRKKLGIDKETDQQLLIRCETLWNNLYEFREQRARAMRFTYGDQWGDYITVNGITMKQRDYVSQQGNVALQSNQIATKVNTIAGLMVKEQNEPVCHARDRKEQQYGELLTQALLANCNKNKMNILYINAMEEFIIGGLTIMRESYDWINGRQDSWSNIVNPNYFFFDSTMKDPRFWDASLMGEIHDVPFNELCAKFVKSESDYDLLKEIYTNEASVFVDNDIVDATKKHDLITLDFRTPIDRSLCRVYEVWTKEARPRIRIHDTSRGTLEKINADDAEARKWIKQTNDSRKNLAKQAGWNEAPLLETEFFIDTYWHCKFLAPDGSILWEGESEFPDRSHPYSICATPFTDGRISGYISDAIDHNLAINRAITLHDWIVRAQVKGVTMVPKALVPDDMSYDEFASQWTSIDGLIFYEAKPGVPAPQVFHGSAINFDAARMVEMYKKLMEDSTAASGALQGKTPYSGTSAALYAQQTANSSTPIASLMAKFHSFMEDVSTKKAKNIAAFYDEARFASIAGSINGIFNTENLNLNEVADIEFDLNIKESTETPVYRMISNDYLMEFFRAGAISIEDLLEFGTFPFADKMLQNIQARQAEMQAAQQGKMPGSAPVQQ